MTAEPSSVTFQTTVAVTGNNTGIVVPEKAIEQLAAGNLQAILDRLAAGGYRLVGGVGQYEGIWRMASVRGPEGFIVNLAQRIN